MPLTIQTAVLKYKTSGGTYNEVDCLKGDSMQINTVTGSTPVISAASNTLYICGECSTLSFTPAASGISGVIFESGSTPTVLTVPNTVIWPGWFDPTSLETDTIYELSVVDGIYGVVCAWQA